MIASQFIVEWALRNTGFRITNLHTSAAFALLLVVATVQWIEYSGRTPKPHAVARFRKFRAWGWVLVACIAALFVGFTRSWAFHR